MKKSYQFLEDLSKKELMQLAKIIGVGFLNEPEDKEEIILILLTEPIAKLKNDLKKIKKS